MEKGTKLIVKVKGMGQDTITEYQNYGACLHSSRLNSCKNLLKIEFAKWIQRMLVNTDLNSLEVTDRIIDNIDLKEYCDGYSTSNPLFTKIVFGSVYRVSLEASIQDNREYSDYINSIYNEVSNTCNNIIYLLNEIK